MSDWWYWTLFVLAAVIVLYGVPWCIRYDRRQRQYALDATWARQPGAVAGRRPR